jgi:parallel beta-helix repeat protein
MVVAVQELKDVSTVSFDGDTLYVGGSGPNNYTTIQDAIDNTSDGDTVFVYDDSSPYYENIVIDKMIDVVGEDKYTTIIDGNYSQENSIILSHTGITVEGFTIQNNMVGILILSNDNSIICNIIKFNTKGIMLDNASYNRISNNHICNNKYGILLDNTIYDIPYYFSYDNTFFKNNFIDNDINAYFHCSIGFNIFAFQNRWIRNYWSDSYWILNLFVLPKLIEATNYQTPPITSNRWDIDWRPAREPYDIGG